MGVKGILVVAIFGLLLFPVSGYAEECDMNRLKKLAEQVEVTTEFDYDSVKNGLYSGNLITISGINEEIYMEATDSSMVFDVSDSVDGIISRYLVNTSADKLLIRSTKCSDAILRKVNVDLKVYNILSDYPECKGLKDKVDMCAEFYDGDLDYDRLKSKIEAYKRKSSIRETTDKDNQLLDFITNYGLYIAIVLFSVVGIIFVLYRFKKNKLD